MQCVMTLYITENGRFTQMKGGLLEISLFRFINLRSPLPFNILDPEIVDSRYDVNV